MLGHDWCKNSLALGILGHLKLLRELLMRKLHMLQWVCTGSSQSARKWAELLAPLSKVCLLLLLPIVSINSNSSGTAIASTISFLSKHADLLKEYDVELKGPFNYSARDEAGIPRDW